MNENLALSDNPSMPEKFSEETTSETQTDEVTQPNQVPEPQVDTNDIITLSRKDLQNEIDRLRREDSDFAQVYNRDIGNKAKSRYQPEIDALRRNLEAQQLLVRRNEYAALTQEQVNERFKSDPQFAADYAKVTHAQEPQVADFNPQEIATAVNSVLGFARRVLTPEQLTKLQADIDAEKYDKDESGNPYSQYSWREGLDRLQEDIVSFTRQGTTQPVETKPIETIHQDTARPDMSNGSSVNSNNQGKFTIQQVRNMSWEEQIRRWPDGYEKAIENGEIIVPGLNDR